MVRTLEGKTLHFAWYPNVSRSGAHQSSVWYPKGTVMPQEQAARLGLSFELVEGEWEEAYKLFCGQKVPGFLFKPA